ncbi:MAG: hypothetical protein IKA04_10095 [Alistipes sp.]|nr:hypothetical protein [Alistipes sp.]
MKKILLLVALVALAWNASAWSKNQDEGVVILATNYLTPKAKSVVENYLGTSYSDDVAYLVSLEKEKINTYSKEVHYLHLNTSLQPASSDSNDAFRAIEESLAIVATRDSRSKEEVTAALRTVINLMCDMHYLSKVRIEGVEHSYKNFNVYCQANASGKNAEVYNRVQWSKFWDTYAKYHKGFFGQLWADDMAIRFGDRYEEFSKGNLRDWAQLNGEKAAQLYVGFTPECQISRIERLRLEELHYEMMGRAGMRLAKLLNEAIK